MDHFGKYFAGFGCGTIGTNRRPDFGRILRGPFLNKVFGGEFHILVAKGGIRNGKEIKSWIIAL
jgi:hypothetical protein